MSRYKKLIVVLCVVIVLSLYLIGINIIKRLDRVDQVSDVVKISEQTYQSGEELYLKTEEEEDAELDAIGDKININTATVSELCLLDGIGETTAQKIIEKREQLGGFSAIDQILEVDGIGKAKYEVIKDYIKTE